MLFRSFFAPQRPGPDLVFNTVVVHGHATFVGVAHQRAPALERVVHRFGGGCAIGDAMALRQQPRMQRLKELAKDLKSQHPDAAASVLEGLDEMFTITELWHHR